MEVEVMCVMVMGIVWLNEVVTFPAHVCVDVCGCGSCSMAFVCSE